MAVDGTVRSLPVELAVAPVCALPGGRFLLPGASETWRDGADEPLHTVSVDGAVEEWLVGGETIKPSQLLAKVAPDLLPDALPTDPRYPAWTDDEGLWVTAARLVDGGRSVVLLLAENTWPPDHHEPEASAWLIVRVRPEDGSVELLARGERADGDHLAIAL